MNKIHVLYILNATDPFGGATKAIMNLSDGIREQVSSMFILPSDSGIAETMRQKGIPYKVLNYRMCVYPPTEGIKDIILFLPRLLGRILVNRKAAKQLTRIAQDFHADIIHTNTSVNDIGYQAARRLGIPHVWHAREYTSLYYNYHYYPTRSRFLSQLRTKQSYSICITKDLQRYVGLDSWPLSRVIYDGVLSETQCFFTPDKENYFLFAGRLEEGKGVKDLLAAYASYCTQTSDPIPLWIAGYTPDTEYKNKLIAFVQEKQLASYVHFLGMRSDVLELMQKATALIVPSKAEGFGFITAEGMFCGALVIGRNVWGTKEQFDNGLAETGHDIALKYETQEELTNHLVRVTQQGITPFMEMIQAGQRVAKQLYSVENHRKAVLDFYFEILNNRPL